jgi:outer membrane protein assembly factor BamA
MKFTSCWIALIVACCLQPPALFALQENGERKYEIASVEFDGNETFSNSELLQLMQTKPTPGFLNKFLYKTISERLGSPDQFLDREVLLEDCRRIRQLYLDNGFYDIRVDSLVTLSSDSSSVEITIRIVEGYRSIIDTLTIEGTSNAPDFVNDFVRTDRKISQGDPFNKSLLEEEVKRILLILKNSGYARASFQRESSSVAYYTSTRNTRVALVFSIGLRYVFRDVAVLNELRDARPDIDDEDILSQLDYRAGEFYDHEKVRLSERNLNRVGIFDQARIDTNFSVDPTDNGIATSVKVKPGDKQEIAPEVSFSDENNNFNFGTGISYTNRNFLSGLRTFTTTLRFRTQNFRSVFDFINANSDAVANVNLTFEVVQPYVFSNKIRGTWSLSAIADKQQLYLSRILQNRFGFTERVTETTTSFLDWTLQRVQLERRQSIAIDSTDPDELRQLQELIAQERDVQFNSILSFTIQRDLTNDVFSPSRGLIHALTLEESGLLALALKSLQPDLPFTQFYRVSTLLRWYFDVSGGTRYHIVAFKLKGGFEDKWGESRSDTSRSIPQAHRFYAGGGGSVRGWRSRELSATGSPQFGGNILAEGSIELRTNVLQSLRDDFFDKFWTVLFLDAGNIWSSFRRIQIKGVAIAAGFGLRYETFFGPFRIDYGLQVYDPGASINGKQWITEKKFFGETLRSGVIHFGIGHSF